MVQVTWRYGHHAHIWWKSLKNLLLRNQKADDLESWYAASGAGVLPSFSNDDWVNHDLFYGKVNFGPLCFCMGKGKTMEFSETIVVYDIKVGTCS